MNSEHVAAFFFDFDHFTDFDADLRQAGIQRTRWFHGATVDEQLEFWQELARRDLTIDRHTDILLAAAMHNIAAGARAVLREGVAAIQLDTRLTDWIGEVYRELGAESEARGHLIGILAAARSRSALTQLADLLVEDPPADSTTAIIGLSPLFQYKDYSAEALFPRLLDGLGHVAVAAAILDLANFSAREGLLPFHPGRDRLNDLVALFSGVVGRLGAMETSPPNDTDSAKEISARVNEAVALAVSICDALALIGDRSVVGKLYQAMELKHRRIRTEAAAALTRLGEKAGSDALIELAEEPVARLRVLAYADELQLLDRIDPEYQEGPARAEAELSLWLAQPSQLGIPPSRLELIDQRNQFWPGFDEPIDCYLFRFAYGMGESEFSNIGIAGPLTHAFAADLSDLPPADIYAAFAGWQAEHDDIYELEVNQLDELQRVEVSRLERRMHDAGFEEIQPLILGFFFGQRALVARTQNNAVGGIVVMDADESVFVPCRGQRPVGPADVYSIFKGRRLLRSFNPDDT